MSVEGPKVFYGVHLAGVKFEQEHAKLHWCHLCISAMHGLQPLQPHTGPLGPNASEIRATVI